MTTVSNCSRILDFLFIQMRLPNVEETIRGNCKSFLALLQLPWQPKISNYFLQQILLRMPFMISILESLPHNVLTFLSLIL